MNICSGCGQPVSPKDTIIALSGYFDPIHEGHVDMITEAATYGRVHIYLNTDEAAIRKKGYVFQNFKTRAAVLNAVKGVELVVPAMDQDGTVCENIKTFKPDIFGNGGDRSPENTPELKLCNDLRIRTLFGLGGQKVQSSSELVKRVQNADT